MVGLYMGFRIAAEVLTLKKENVDLENRVITILAAYEKTEKTQSLRIHSCLIGPLLTAIEKSTCE
jgi:integrase